MTMVLDHLGNTARMGPKLLAEVDRQLVEDLRGYGINELNLKFDWSDACGEGHCTSALDGNLEDLSSVYVTDANGDILAGGWIDFVHGGGTNPLFVFWLFLSVKSGDELRKVKEDNVLPKHIWDKLPPASKQICTNEDSYDARWCKDPVVQAWKRENAV